ncbi:MAG: AI-2E family transporter [Balneolaceae bacterium]
MEFLKKANRLLFFLLAVFLAFIYLDAFLIPFGFGIFLAMLIVPFSSFLEKHKVNTALSSLTSTLLLFICLGSLSYLFMYQISHFADQLPDVREEIQSTMQSLQLQITSMTGVPPEEQQDIVDSRSDALWSGIESRIAAVIGGILDFAFKFMLVFIYVFLLLLYREKFRSFLISFHETEEEKENARDAVNSISKVVYHYLWGRVQVMSALAVMYYVTFLVFGLPFALLVTLFGALITVIPYLGPLVSGIVPVIFAILFFEDLSYILIFALCILVIQLIESYVFEPFLIGKEVKLNALVVIVAVILGGTIWGVAGMILFVPMFATIKIIFNHSDGLRPLGSVLE